MVPDKSILIVSLDFELYWGVRENRTIQEYESNLKGTGKAIKEILAVFEEYDIHATWAVVGFLFFKNVEGLKNSCPGKLPQYVNPSLSPYQYIYQSKLLEAQYHFAPELIEQICGHRNQEIATHTFSHYYCLEKTLDAEAFKADLSSAIKAAEDFGLGIKSMVFPRNQVNDDLLPVLQNMGIKIYRGNQKGWANTAADNKKNNQIARRAYRLLDSYTNLSGYHTFRLSQVARQKPYNVPSSCFLRPFSKKLKALESLRQARITRAMFHAAKNNAAYHLWWHPHNFGVNTIQNICFLRKILDHYKMLNKKYGMESLNMGEVADFLDNNR